MRRSHRTSATLSIGALAVAALVLPAAAASAAPVTYPAVVDEGITVVSPFPNYELEVDCEDFLDQYAIDELGFYGELYHVPGGSLTITFNCEIGEEGFDIDELAGVAPVAAIDVTVGDGSTIVTVEPNTRLQVDVWPIEVDGYFELEYYQTALLGNPGGSLLHEVTQQHPGASGPLAGFAIGQTGPVYNCVSDGVKPYMTQVVTVLTAGTYTFRYLGYQPYEGGLYYDYSPAGDGAPANPWGTYNPFADPAFVLYSTFNPSNTDAGFIDCNDDSEAIDDLITDEFNGYGGARDGQNRFLDDYFPELVITLQPGTYTLVTIPYDGPSTDIQQNQADLESTFVIEDLGAMSTEFEIWGQAGGLVLGSQLAATGPESNGAAGLAGLAALMLVLGAAVVVVRRRVA